MKAKCVFSTAIGIKVKPGSDQAKIEKWESDDSVAMFTISSAMKLSQSCLSKVALYQRKCSINWTLLSNLNPISDVLSLDKCRPIEI